MQRPVLIFEHSPLFLFLCILAGLGYAYILYRKGGPWNATVNKVLFGLRFILATVLTALLVSPVLKQIQNTIESPSFVIGIDNSLSIASATDSTAREGVIAELETLGSSLEEQGFEVDYRSLSNRKVRALDSVYFDHESSNLNQFLEDVAVDYEGRNLAGAVFLSDGIYNEGISPTYKDFSFNVYPVGLGDSVPKADLSIASVLYNKISYQGNKFPLLVQFTQQGYAGQEATVSLIKEGQRISSQKTKMANDNQLNELQFLIETEKSGFQRYTVVLESKEGEYTYLNNRKQAYVEVIEGKENIALVAAAPHPDIKAIRYAIESNANYSFDQFILSIPEDRARLGTISKQYDLLIYHQIPDKRGLSNQYLDVLQKQNPPILMIYGGHTDVNRFNQQNGVLEIDAVGGEYDNVTAAFNSAFGNFKLSDQLQETFEQLPPISVPFGKINLQQGATTLLYQRVGSITTSKPLIALNAEKTPKKAVVLGDGLWQWKLTDFVINENEESFSELITKLVQFLSSKEDKRKFKAYPIKNEFTTNEQVVFDTEVYNDLYERVYGNKINLNIKDVNGKSYDYTFITNENNTRYATSGLPEGVYKYVASTTIDDKAERASGEFIIKELQIENVNLTADFNMLRRLAQNSGGSYYHSTHINQLTNDLTQLQVQGIIHSSEKFLPFINLKWLFFVLLLLITIEWFIRKYSGSY